MNPCLARLSCLAALATACAEDDALHLEMLPRARLSADATRPAAGLPWPREDTDAIACVRDGHPHTGWKPTQNAPARVEIDLQPWLGGMARLERLELDWPEGAPARLSLELREGCGGELRERLLISPEPRALLALDGRRAGCLTLAVEASTPVRLAGLSLAGEVPASALPDPTGPSPGPRDMHTGVIEGFYGVPWSPGERRRMLAHLAHLGLGSYVYAPKDDPLHRARWREPYPDEALEEFEALADFARERGMRFRLGLSPFIDFDPNEADAAALVAKLAPLVDRGLVGVVLLADDIEDQVGRPIDGALGQEHATAVNRVAAWLAASGGEQPALWFVPTVYTDERLDLWPGGEAYLRALQELDPAVELMWVGPLTSNAEMRAADLERVSGLTGRQPLVWENYWANDGGDGFMGRILLGAFEGRDADLPAAVRGLSHNPSIQGALSRLALGTFAAYWAAPGPVDAPAARALAAGAELDRFPLHARLPGGEAREALALAMEVFDGHAQRFPAFGRLEAALDALAAELDAGLPDDGRLQVAALALLPALADMRTLRARLHHGPAAADLVDELDFPFLRVECDARMGLGALCALGAALGGPADPGCLEEAAQARQAAGRTRFALGSARIPALLDRALALPFAPRGFVAPALAPPPACQAGARMVWRAGGDGAALAVRGLPGGRLEQGTLAWTPPHPGRYRALIFAAPGQGLGWSFREDELVCR